MTGELWYHLAARVERLDAQAGRALRRALAEHAAPMRVQVAGRVGTGRELVEVRVQESVGDEVSVGALVVGVAVDRPDGPDPVLDADLVVYVVPRRPDPTVAHPADRAALAAVDPRRVVLVVSGEVPAVECAVIARSLGVAQDRTVASGEEQLVVELLVSCAAVARRLRDEQLTRAAAAVPATPQVRELVEQVLDLVDPTCAAGSW